jgi:hypothetical protein
MAPAVGVEGLGVGALLPFLALRRCPADKKLDDTAHGPQPLRLPPNQLFFGYAIKPVKPRDENGQVVPDCSRRGRVRGRSLAALFSVETLSGRQKVG